MSRLFALVFSTALTCAAAAPLNAYGQDLGLRPPKPSPTESIGYAGGYLDAVLSHPCFFGGCRYDPRDACVPGGSCGGSWGGVSAADERSTIAAYRALSAKASAMAAEGEVSPVTLDPGSGSGERRHVRRARDKAPE